MYNNTSYEEYMRTVLGYTPNCMQDTFNTNDYYIMPNNYMNDDDLENFYPEIYRKVYPLVSKECSNNNMPITQEILEQMTDNVLSTIDIDLKIETRKEDGKNSNTRQQQDRSPRQNNNLLRDLIRILILNELLRRRHNRPQFSGNPPRPPMHGPRPPFPIGNTQIF